MEISKISGVTTIPVPPVIGPKQVTGNATGVARPKEQEKVNKVAKKNVTSKTTVTSSGGRHMSDLQDSVELSEQARSLL
ncbi:hypothetical protein Sarmat_00817 [Rickettsiales endosymbiont of Paramecium tredecaurelia]|uniref:hypothetical protein n=1 Tax=Candidatus Sarmatiella mevalonica TaxID=2770581 RepID=UPI001921089B|nr:hypothetical protein [Candidatus Sarmatiella mevalonica]MBL3284957.1 hypothetical protein [Candidatus Sarmatiella mevalonica]